MDKQRLVPKTMMYSFSKYGNNFSYNEPYYIFQCELLRNQFGTFISNIAHVGSYFGMTYTQLFCYLRAFGVYIPFNRLFQTIRESLEDVKVRTPNILIWSGIAEGLGLGLGVLLMRPEEFQVWFADQVRVRGLDWVCPVSRGGGLAVVRGMSMGRWGKGYRRVVMIQAGVWVHNSGVGGLQPLTAAGKRRAEGEAGIKWVGEGDCEVVKAGQNGRGEWVLLLSYRPEAWAGRRERGEWLPDAELMGLWERMWSLRMLDGVDMEAASGEGDERMGWHRFLRDGLPVEADWRPYLDHYAGVRPNMAVAKRYHGGFGLKYKEKGRKDPVPNPKGGRPKKGEVRPKRGYKPPIVTNYTEGRFIDPELVRKSQLEFRLRVLAVEKRFWHWKVPRDGSGKVDWVAFNQGVRAHPADVVLDYGRLGTMQDIADLSEGRFKPRSVNDDKVRVQAPEIRQVRGQEVDFSALLPVPAPSGDAVGGSSGGDAGAVRSQDGGQVPEDMDFLSGLEDILG